MKCSRCGKRANTIAGMARHFRKKHPGAMRRKAHSKAHAPPSAKRPPHSPQGGATFHYCPNCGAEINPCYKPRSNPYSEAEIKEMRQRIAEHHARGDPTSERWAKLLTEELRMMEAG